MGGRQHSKKKQVENDPVSVSGTDIQTESVPATEHTDSQTVSAGLVKLVNEPADAVKKGEWPTTENMQLHQAVPNSGEIDELKELRKLGEVRIDDPRVVWMSPGDPRLVLDKFKVRKDRDWGFVRELHGSMVKDGQQKAIIATPRGEPGKKELWVVIGNTRTIAARIGNEIEKIYVLVKELTDRQAWFIALHSNLDNSLPAHALDDEEQGSAILKLIDEYDLTQQQVAELVHRDQSWVSRQSRLAKVDPEIERMVKDGKITESHAGVIMTLPKTYQEQVASEVESEKLTVQATQKIVTAFKSLLKEAEGLPEDWLGEEILEPILNGGLKGDATIEGVKAATAGLRLLSDDIKEMGFRSTEDFANTVIEEKMDPERARNFAKSLNILLQDTAVFPKESRESMIESVLDGSKTTEDVRKIMDLTKIAAESKKLPKHIRDLLMKHFEGSRFSYSPGKPQHYTVSKAEELISNLEEIFPSAKAFPAEVQTKLVERIIDNKLTLEGAKALTETIALVIEESRDIQIKTLRSELIKHIAEHSYTTEGVKQLVDAVKRAQSKNSEYEITSELKWRDPKDWKVLELTPEIEAAHREERKQRIEHEEAESLEAVDTMIREGQLTLIEAEPIRTLPKILQGKIAESLMYDDDDGNEQRLPANGIRKMVVAVQQRIEGKTPEEVYKLNEGYGLDDLLQADEYVEKPGEQQKPGEAEVSEIPVATHISSGPVSEEPPIEVSVPVISEEKLAPSATDLKKSRVTQAAAPYLEKFNCPHCNKPVVLDLDKMIAYQDN